MEVWHNDMHGFTVRFCTLHNIWARDRGESKFERERENKLINSSLFGLLYSIHHKIIIIKQNQIQSVIQSNRVK